MGRWILAANLLLSAAALGSLHTPVLAIVCGLAFASTFLLWFDAEPLKARPAATVLVTAGAVLVGWTLLQLVPLPRGLLAFVAPENADVWARALSPLHEDGPSLAPISLDPTATRVQVLRGVTYLLVFVSALRVAQRREGVAFLERALVACAILLAAAALLHPTFGARKVFGLYEPSEKLGYSPHHLAPLLNVNHLAAFVNVGLLVAFGAVLSRRDSLPRAIAAAAVPLLVGTTMWTLSRGGVAAMLLGALVVIAMTFAAKRMQNTKIVAPIIGSLVALIGVALFLFSTFEDTRAKFALNDLSKLAMARNALELLRSFGLFGVGRGAFESTFPAIRRGSDYWVFTHPENVVAQWTTEWGVPFALLGFGAILFALRPQTALARSRPPIGAWAALVAAAIHNLVDFNSEVPGVVLSLCVCAAIVTGGSGGTSKGSRVERWSSRPNALVLAGGIAITLAIGATLPFAQRELYNEQRALRDYVLESSTTKEAFHARVRDAMLRHPAEPYFPFVGAVRAIVARDESVIPWAARALERSFVYGRVHLLLARSLFVGNPSQARLEYKLACEQDRQLCGVKEALPLVSDFDDALELVPEGTSSILVLEALGQGLAPRLPSTVWRIDEELATRDPLSLAPVRRAAEASLSDVRNGESWCEGSAACLDDGLTAARKLRTAEPGKCDGHALAAELQIASGQIDRGLDDLERSLDGVLDRANCTKRLVQMTLPVHRPARTDAAIDRLIKLGCETSAECVDNLAFAASIESGRGNGRRALALTKRASDRAPERDDLLVTVAELATAQGVHGEALEAYTKLSRRHPDETRWAERAASAKANISRGVFELRR